MLFSIGPDFAPDFICIPNFRNVGGSYIAIEDGNVLDDEGIDQLKDAFGDLGTVFCLYGETGNNPNIGHVFPLSVQAHRTFGNDNLCRLEEDQTARLFDEDLAANNNRYEQIRAASG